MVNIVNIHTATFACVASL